MARKGRSRIGAFGYGLGFAGAITATALSAHYYFAPPTPDADVAVSQSIAGFAQSAGAIAERLASNITPRGRASLREPETVAVPAAVEAPKPAKPLAKFASHSDTAETSKSLTRGIQQELQRVGCYAGPINGTWDEATRSGMESFNANVRVQLKVTGPDYILLTLLQGHGAKACGDSRTSVARHTPSPEHNEKAPRVAATSSPAERTSTASGTERVAPPAPPKASWRTTIVAAPPVLHPPAPIVRDVAAAAPAPTVPPAIAAPVAPLPGRMAVGGPASVAVDPVPQPAPSTAVPRSPAHLAPDSTTLAPSDLANLSPAAPTHQAVNKAGARNRPGPIVRRDSPRDIFARLGMSAP